MNQTARINHILTLVVAITRELEEMKRQQLRTRPIPEAPGYLARSDGRIIGKSGKPLSDAYQNYGKKFRDKHGEDGGYLRFDNRQNGRRVSQPLQHRAICEAFNGPPPTPKHTQVHHINDDHRDNRPENLKWVTPAEHASLHAEAKRNRWII